MMNPIVTGWYESTESRSYFNSLLKRNRRRTFGSNQVARSALLYILAFFIGVLEKPSVDPSLPELKLIKYKVFLVGKAAVGKTSTVARLSGRDVPLNHEETIGVQTTNIYWPVKVGLVTT